MTDYRCPDCDVTIRRDNQKGVRIRAACPDCQTMQSFERVAEVSR